MQVDRQPSPWPCVIMLLGLLIVCLAAPSYWQDDVVSRLNLPGAAAQTSNADRPLAKETVIWPINIDDLYGQFGITGYQSRSVEIPTANDNTLLGLLPVPTIEELVSARLGAPQHDDATIDWPVIIAPPRRAPTPPAEEPAVPGELTKFVLLHIGQAAADYSPAKLASRMANFVTDVYRQWSEANEAAAIAFDANHSSPSTLRLVRPGGDAPVASDPWCIPNVLFEQLEQLAEHPYTAAWSERTLAQLHALTERNRPEGDDVQAILASLSESTLEAVQMAEDTHEDRLRVALLRAHWGLARRLDRWAVVHDIRVAELSSQRVAARGSLGQYFDGVPMELSPRTDTLALTTNLEEYEQNRDPQLAREVVREQRVLAESSESLDRALADAVEQHYRNANVRIAITAEMLNRFAGGERSEFRPVRDRIAGTPVRGQSHTMSESRVNLNPATGSWQMELEAQGVVDSNTLADGGQARLRSHSATDYSARKRVVVDSTGVVLQPAWIDVSSRNRLVGVTTDYDWVPLFGAFARDRAAQQYRARQRQTRMEVESRVSDQAVEALDEAVVEAVDRIERQVRGRFTDRFAEAGIKVTPIEMTTTNERVVARLRVAGDEQLGSHTPRPRALSDSLASVQVHETALTNAALSLELDGNRYTADELRAALREKFPRMTFENSEENRTAVFDFAPENAVQFHMNDGRLEITLAFKSVELDGRSMRRFLVHAFYTPVVNGLEAQLVRDGSLGIEGRLSSSQRARLHNVFNNVLPADRPLSLVRLEDPNDQRMAGLMITQLVLEDGWLGIAIGPATSERVAERSRSLR